MTPTRKRITTKSRTEKAAMSRDSAQRVRERRSEIEKAVLADSRRFCRGCRTPLVCEDSKELGLCAGCRKYCRRCGRKTNQIARFGVCVRCGGELITEIAARVAGKSVLANGPVSTGTESLLICDYCGDQATTRVGTRPACDDCAAEVKVT
ncbi:MAG: hypothetical protein WC683_06960 [bacterium]